VTRIRLQHATDAAPGHRRVGSKRFRYLDAAGRALPDDEVLRIRRLAIPPAWTDVWIAPDPRWHLQATGRDARGRKQYRYHDAFREQREATKFDELVAFGRHLPRLRRHVAADLASRALTGERVLAAVVRLLDRTHLRVGNEEYARTNRSYGLTTLRTRHVHASPGAIRLHFRGKAAHEFDVTVDDPDVARVVRKCRDLPGQLLFQYEDDDGRIQSITSADVNRYLQDNSAGTATAKTFRTWGATVLGAVSLASVEPPERSRDRARAVNRAITDVAAELGNTLAVCKRSYVHPAVFAAFEADQLAARWKGRAPTSPSGLSSDERRTWHLIEGSA